jgi:hypothetical protein
MLDRYFTSIAGLPTHILVVHGVVVLIPLLSLVTLAFTVRPKWRPGLGWAVLGNALAVGVAVVARQSGFKFRDKLGVGGADAVQKHARYGTNLWLFALGLFLASVLAWFLVRRGRTGVVIAIVLVVAAGAAATSWTVLTGDSGSRAVWSGVKGFG